MNKNHFLIFIAGFFFHNLVCIDFDLQKKASQLTIAHPFAFFDLQLSQQDLDLLQSLPIGVSQEFQKHETIALNHYGNLDGYQQKFMVYLRSLGCDDQQAFDAAKIIYNIVHNVLLSLDQPEAWIAIRAFRSNHSYDEPRWHIDRPLYTTDCGYVYRIIYTLQGASTLLCDVSATLRAEFGKMQSSRTYAKQPLRTRLANLLKNCPVLSAGAGQATVFMMGSEHCGAIHSEPAMSKSRIVISIIPGSHDEIQELYDTSHKIITNRFR